MDKRTFDIPDDLDEPDVDAVPCHFQPGRIFNEFQKGNGLESSKEEDLVSPPSTQGSLNIAAEGNTFCIDSCVDAISAAHDQPVYNSKPCTSFGSSFSNLMSSKFFKNEDLSEFPEKGTRNTGVLLVNPRQRGNPLLKHIRNVPWEFAEMEPDYVMAKTACALFLSMKYHNLFPNYIHERLRALGKSFQLRVLLVQVDVVEPSQALKDLSVIAILADCTLMVSWSAEEAGNYLETYKLFENKSADLIKEKPFDDSFSQLVDCLTIVRSINKTDAAVLLSTFGTLAKVFQASTADLAVCPGIGLLKAKRLYEALHKPLASKRSATKANF